MSLYWGGCGPWCSGVSRILLGSEILWDPERLCKLAWVHRGGPMGVSLGQ